MPESFNRELLFHQTPPVPPDTDVPFDLDDDHDDISPEEAERLIYEAEIEKENQARQDLEGVTPKEIDAALENLVEPEKIPDDYTVTEKENIPELDSDLLEPEDEEDEEEDLAAAS